MSGFSLSGKFGMAALVLAFVLSGCMEGRRGLLERPDTTAAPERPAAVGVSERDVEAPEIFNANDEGLWDGRPSLGGIWVAYPDVASPERVIIRNASNGQSVIGALFKREREHPGPRLQVSSDAAAALGLLAGQPTMLEVTALRQREPETPDETAGSIEDVPGPTGTAVSDSETSNDLAADPEQVAAVPQTDLGKQRRWMFRNPFRREPASATAAVAVAPATLAEEQADAGVEP